MYYGEKMSDETFKTEISVREIMSSPIITVNENSTALETAKVLKDNKISSAIVVDAQERPIGIVTKGDLVYKVIAENKDPATVKIKNIMSRPIKYVEADDTVQKALKIFRTHKVSKLGVMYKGKMVGIVSLNDAIRVIPEIMDILSEKVLIKRGLLPTPKLGAPIIGYCDHCGNWSDELKEVDGNFYCPDCIADFYGQR